MNEERRAEIRVEQLANEFLKKHRDADEIVMELMTGLPAKAVYSGLDATGNRRSKPAVFWFEVPNK